MSAAATFHAKQAAQQLGSGLALIGVAGRQRQVKQFPGVADDQM